MNAWTILHSQPRQPPHGNYVILVICICNFVICIDIVPMLAKRVKCTQARAFKWLRYAKSRI